MRKKQYASMQKELAARKAAAGYIEEPRARIGGAQAPGAGQVFLENLRTRRGLQIWLGFALALFIVGLTVAILLPDGPDSGPDYPFDAYSTDAEIVEYIDERWSIDKEDHRHKIQLLSWAYRNQDTFGFPDIGDWNLDASQNFAILRTTCPAYMDQEEFYRNCRTAATILEDSVYEDGPGGPAAIIARDFDTGELGLVLINGAVYYQTETESETE